MTRTLRKENNMEISGKVNIFVEDNKGKTGTFKTFTTTISTKDKNGKYLNKSMEVRFNRDNITEEQTNKLLSTKCYTLEVESAWLSVRSYSKIINEQEEERKVIYLYIDKATIKSAKDVRKVNPSKNDDLPF